MLLRACLAIACIGSLPAAVWHVDHDSPGTPKDGQSWNGAYLDLQQALDAAQAGDEVWVAAGTYRPTRRRIANQPRTARFVLTPGVKVYGGFFGNEASAANRVWQMQPTILEGDANGDDGANWTNRTDNVYHVVVGAHGARLDGFIVSGGNAAGSDCRDTYGGGLLTHACPGGTATPPLARRGMTVANCLFEDNYALRGGGAVAAVGELDVVQACALRRNRATSGDPAHPAVGGGLAYWGGLEVSRLIAHANQADLGGGVYIGRGGPLTVFANWLVVGSTAGAGVVFDHAEVPLFAYATVFGNVSGSAADGDRGAGLRIAESDVSASLCLVTGNEVHDPGITWEDAFLRGSIDNRLAAAGCRFTSVNWTGGGLYQPLNPIGSDPTLSTTSGDPCGADSRYFTADDGYQLLGGGGLNPSVVVPALAPEADILGRSRGAAADAGAYEFSATGGIGESTGAVDSSYGTAVAPPVVSLTSPVAATVSGGTVLTLAASVTAAAGVREVRFYEDDTLLGTVSVAPYSGTRAFPGGTRSYRAVAIDLRNAWTESAAIAITDGGGGGGGGGETPAAGGGGGCGAGALAGLLLLALRRRR